MKIDSFRVSVVRWALAVACGTRRMIIAWVMGGGDGEFIDLINRYKHLNERNDDDQP